MANFGVVIIHRGRGSRVEPRVVAGLDENRLTGYAGLPINHNPYMEEFREPTLAAGALSPIPGGVRSCLRQRGASRRGLVPFPLLGERRHPADAATPNALGRPQEQPVRIAASDAGAGVYREVDRRPRSTVRLVTR